MPPDTLAVLLASNAADDIMQITKRLRSFYPGCRVETVYSLDETLEWSTKQDWSVIVVDQALVPDVPGAIQRIRARVKRATVIMIGNTEDPAWSLETIRHGVDYYLFKHPSFLAELPLIILEVLEKRDARTRLELTQYRFGRLVDTLTDVVYELDLDGRFVYVSRQIRQLLHYEPQELIGQSYAVVVAEDREAARWRFNERRSDTRAGHGSRVRVRHKQHEQLPVDIEVTARSLYDPDGRFLGTIGILRPVTSIMDQMSSGFSDFKTPLGQIVSTARTLLDRIEQMPEHPARLPTPVPSETPVEQPVPGPSMPTETVGDRGAPEHGERRRAARLEVRIDVNMTFNGRTWEGHAVNISVDGLFVVVVGPPPIRPGQRVRLAFVSEVGILDISGAIAHVRQNPAAQDTDAATTGVAIRFSALTDVEGKVLASLIEGLRTQSIAITLRVLIVPEQSPSQEPPPAHTGRGPSDEPYDQRERRLTVRITLSLPVLISMASAHPSHHALLINISAGGACIEFSTADARPEGRITIRFESTAHLDRPGGPVDRSDGELIGEVVWTKVSDQPRQGMSPDARPRAMVLHVGVRFINDAAARSRIEYLITRYLASPTGSARRQGQRSVLSELVYCRTQQGHQVAVYHDYAEPLPSACPLVILSPGYGETKTDYIGLAYYFARNGFHLLRYDHTNHIGESDGGMVSTTLGGMAADLQSVISFAASTWPTSPLIIVGANVSARTALKAIRGMPHVKLLVLLGPVLDLQHALRAMHREDVVAAAFEGRKQGVTNVLGFNIDADAWLRDAIREGYTDLASTLRDAEALRIPVVVLASTRDLGASEDQARAVKHAFHNYLLEWRTEPEPLLRVFERGHEAAPLFRAIVVRCRTWFYPLAGQEIAEPPEEEIHEQIHMERERLRLHHQMTKANHINFWRDYLDRSHYLINFSDYWHLLDHIYRLLAPFEREMRILDAGCGNGNFGTFLLIARSLHSETPESGPRVHYVGLDLVPSGLDQARQNLLRVAAELRGKFADAVRPQSVMRAALLCADLDFQVPIHDQAFDRVVCNLVLGYLRDPLFTLRELIRVLRPGGKVVITHFKPEADLSQIYRNFLTLSRTPTEVERAKQILEASGNLTQCAREGGFRFFDRHELAVLLMSAGAIQPRIYSAFANQAYIAVADRPL